ncbi:hypothetical protein [Acinetobacter baumannii]|uniref:hypothetical protein n=1 Tax=Acinetobacter baumannii TaxID=470 RepID=UPI0034CF22C6
MNKYTELSDFEINELVSFNLGYVHTKSFDPCNNPAHAMQIIKDNLISITHDGIAWDVSCVKYPELSVWSGLENYNDNFYRKAMELFLLMKDADNEKV